MLKNVCFNNFVLFSNEQKIEFQTQCPYIFIGENGSGKSAVFEGIRRCLKADMNTSVSKPWNPNEVSYFLCRYTLDNDNEEIISGTVYIPLNKALHFFPKHTIEENIQNDNGLPLLIEEKELVDDLGMLTLFSEEDFNGKEGGKQDELKLRSSFKLDKTGPDTSLELEDTIDTAAEKGDSKVTTPELDETCSAPEFDDTIDTEPGLDDIHAQGHNYQFVIKYTKNKEVSDFCCDFLKLPMSTKDKGNIQVYEVRNFNTCPLNKLHSMLLDKQTSTDNTIENVLLQTLSYKEIELALVDASTREPTSTPCQSLLTDLSKNVVFTFPLRGIGPLQWSESERIKGDKKEANYEEAQTRCEIIIAFLKNPERYDKSIEQDVFEKITDQSAEYEFTLDEDGKLQVNHNSMKLLKTPEGILEAKYVSILLSGKGNKTILLEEPDRGMHPQFVQRMTQAIKHQAKASGKVVILTTHNTTFLTPWTLSSCFRFSRADNVCTVKSVGTFVRHNMKTLRIMTNDKLSDIFFAKRVLFCEGDSESLFLNEMKNVLLSARSSACDNPIYATNAFLSEYEDKLQTVLSDLTIAKMNSVCNLTTCRTISRNLCLPAKFVVDKDFENLKKDLTGCFIWNEGAIEEMVLSMRDSSDDEQLTQIVSDLKLKPLAPVRKRKWFMQEDVTHEQITGCVEELLRNFDESNDRGKFLEQLTQIVSELRLDPRAPGRKRNGKDKLFMQENVTQEQITRCVEALLRNCDESNDLGKFLEFLIQPFIS